MLILDKYQKDILETEGNIAMRSGRQVGKSTVISILAAKEAVKSFKKTIMIISSVERQAYLLFDKTLQYLEENHKQMILGGKNRPTKTRIRLKNGSIIYCLPTGLSGQGIRGFTIDILIADEAAFIPDNVYAAVTPALAARKGARIILLSTPFGRSGYFARAFKDDTFTKFHISSEECERINKEFLAQEKARMTKLQYQQEYMGEFVDKLMQFFSDEIILKVMTGKRRSKIYNGLSYYLGVDLARMGDDQSTFEIVELTRDKKLIHIENQTTERTLLSQSTKHILELNRLYNFQKIFIDEEGIGVGVYDHLLDKEDTKRKIIPINNSKRVLDSKDKNKTRLLKEDLYNNLLGLMEREDIQLLDDPEIFQSLKSVQYEYTSDKKGKPHLKIFGNYTHITEGLIRAAWCIKYKVNDIWLKSFKI
jgi:hypothetical protein